MREAYISKTFEAVYGIDDPAGVSWLTASSLQLDGHPDYEPFSDECGVDPECEDCNRWGVFPVSTEELLGIKGTALALGDTFELALNLDARSPADVDPQVLRYLPPVPDEELNRIMNGE